MYHVRSQSRVAPILGANHAYHVGPASQSLRPYLSNLKAEPITRTMLDPSSLKTDPNPISKSAKLVPKTYDLRCITSALKVVWHLFWQTGMDILVQDEYELLWWRAF